MGAPGRSPPAQNIAVGRGGSDVQLQTCLSVPSPLSFCLECRHPDESKPGFSTSSSSPPPPPHLTVEKVRLKSVFDDCFFMCANFDAPDPSQPLAHVREPQAAFGDVNPKIIERRTEGWRGTPVQAELVNPGSAGNAGLLPGKTRTRAAAGSDKIWKAPLSGR